MFLKILPPISIDQKEIRGNIISKFFNQSIHIAASSRTFLWYRRIATKQRGIA